ncbi:MAG: hypothetical protein AAFR87_12940 [Bacteroidota bacterium]
MKTILIFSSFFLLILLGGFTQNSTELIFTISDTLWVEADHLELKLSHVEFNKDTIPPEELGGPRISFEELKEKLKEYEPKYIYDKHAGIPDRYQLNFVEKVIHLNFSSKQELVRCIKQVGIYARVFPQIGKLEIEDPTVPTESVFQATLDKGKKKAIRYGSLMNQKVIGLKSVEELQLEQLDPREIQDSHSGGWTIYPPLSALAPEDIPLRTDVPFVCTLKLTFELE